MEPKLVPRVRIAADANVLLELADDVKEAVEAFDLPRPTAALRFRFGRPQGTFPADGTNRCRTDCRGLEG
jgi:hypothetical protein